MECLHYTGTIGASRLESGLEGIGFHRTKTGSNETVRSYWVQRSRCLMLLCCVVLCVVVLCVGIIGEKVELRWVNREIVMEEVKHWKSEHGAQLKLMTVLLQQRDQLQEQTTMVAQLEELRTFILKEQNTDNFPDKVVTELEKILEPMKLKAVESEEMLQALQMQIVQEASDDEKEKEFYVSKLRQHGITLDQKKNFEKNSVEQENDPEEKAHLKEVERESEEYEGRVKEALTVFFHQAKNNKFPKVKRHQIQRLEKFRDLVIKDLQDTNKEIDPPQIIRGLEKILSTVAPDYPKYDKEDKGNKGVVLYMNEVIRAAKVAAHMPQFLTLEEQFLSNELTAMQVLSKTETILSNDDTEKSLK